MVGTSDRISVQTAPARYGADENTYAPLVDIYEEPDGTVVLEAEVPGAPPAKIDVRVEKGVLTVYADGRTPEFAKDYGRTYTGFAGGEYFRAFALSDEIDRDRIASSLSNGVLVIRLPRAAAAKTRKIEIKER